MSDVIPLQVRRRWEAAEGEIATMILGTPQAYERTIELVRLAVDTLRPQCPDVRSLLAAADRPEDTTTTVADAAAAAGVSTTGVRLDLVVSTALAVRGRELASERARAGRLAALTRARIRRRRWTLVEETGDVEQPLAAPYRRIEVEVATGAAVVASAEPDATLAGAVYRLRRAHLDPDTGALTELPEAEAGEATYRDRDVWEQAAAEARRRRG